MSVLFSKMSHINFYHFKYHIHYKNLGNNCGFSELTKYSNFWQLLLFELDNHLAPCSNNCGTWSVSKGKLGRTTPVSIKFCYLSNGIKSHSYNLVLFPIRLFMDFLISLLKKRQLRGQVRMYLQ